ncbi:ATP/GTP-binding protein [Actinoallomurus sp. NPDC052274]|uniref:GTP-binding protein n=1 Tax=Actinoallomurus sp. NPDC052274 TaxID=3155420 RepID=UPI003419513F
MAFTPSADLTPQLTSVKIVVAGGFGVGKTTLVATASEIEPVSTEAQMTEASTRLDPLAPSDAKTHTTVAMDFGRITLGDHLLLYLFGTPGQARFLPMWDELCRGASAALVLVDTRDQRLADSFLAVNYFENDLDIPFAVAVNLFDGVQTHPLRDVQAALDLPDQVPLIACDARDKPSVVQALITAVEHSLRQTTPALRR